MKITVKFYSSHQFLISCLSIISMPLSFAHTGQEFPTHASEISGDVSTDAPAAALPADYKIDAPVVRKIKKSTDFTLPERALDQYWFQKKSELARILVIDQRRAFAAALAAELNALNDEEFAFLSTQSYFWTDIFGQEPEAFNVLSPNKLRILGDAIINRELIRLERNLPSYLIRLIAKLDITDPMILEKLEAFLPAAVESYAIQDEITKKARAYRQKKQFLKDDSETRLADTLIHKIELAKKTHQERILALRPTRPAPPVPLPVEAPPGPVPILERKRSITDSKREEQIPKRPRSSQADENWRKSKPEFATWLSSDFNMGTLDVNEVKNHLKFLLKQFPLELDDGAKATMRTALVKTMAQANDVNKLFDFLKDMAEEKDIATFMALLHGKAAEGKATDPDLIDLLWKSEKGLIIAGRSVRELQAKRLALIYKNLDDGRIRRSLLNENFWNLVEDQPIAAASGFSSEQIGLIAQYFRDTIRHNKFRPASFAQKVIPMFNPDEAPDEVYASFLALAPVAKSIPALQSAIGLKQNQLGMALKRKYDAKTVSDMIQKLRRAMVP